LVAIRNASKPIYRGAAVGLVSTPVLKCFRQFKVIKNQVVDFGVNQKSL